MFINILLICLAVFLIVMILAGLTIVQQAETKVIERLGKFNRVLSSGVNIIWPIIDKPRQYVSRSYHAKTWTGIALSGLRVRLG